MRPTSINTKNINSHVLRRSTIKAFHDFNGLSGYCKMNIEQIDDGGQFVGPGFVDVPYVFTEGPSLDGRTGFIYMLQEHYIPAGRVRYFLMDTGRYFTADDNDAVLDTVTYIHGLVRLRVKFLFMQIALPCMNRIVFLAVKDLYYASTTTNATGVRFGRTSYVLQRGRTSTGQNGGYGMLAGGRPPGMNAHTIKTIEYFVMSCPSDAGIFGNINVPGMGESCAASNNMRAVWVGNNHLDIGYDKKIQAWPGVAFSTFNTPGNAVTMYSTGMSLSFSGLFTVPIRNAVGNGGATCACNPVSNRMVVCGGGFWTSPAFGPAGVIWRARSDGQGGVVYDLTVGVCAASNIMLYKDMSNSAQMQPFGSLDYQGVVDSNYGEVITTITEEQYRTGQYETGYWDYPGDASSTTSYRFTVSNGSGDRAIFDKKYFTMGTLSNAVIIPNGGGSTLGNIGSWDAKAASDGQEGRALCLGSFALNPRANPYSRYSPEWYLWEKNHPWYEFLGSGSQVIPSTYLMNVNTLSSTAKFSDLPSDAFSYNEFAWDLRSSIGAASDTWN